MTSSSVVAIVVTFHPDHDVLTNLAAIRPQVTHLLVVDNGSATSDLAALRSQALRLNFVLIENGENLGIATALNQGIRHAQSLGAEWVLLFDQDSRVTEGFTATMLHCFETSPWGDRLAILNPRYVDKRTGQEIFPPIPANAGMAAVTTSGTLARTQLFNDHGLFEEKLFIDYVDVEHSLRLRRAGLILDECCDAILLHSPGTPREHRFLGRILFRTGNYSALRHYYQQRNRIWVARRYYSTFPEFFPEVVRSSTADFIKLILAEKDKARKVRFFLRGIFDGLRERMGKLTE